MDSRRLVALLACIALVACWRFRPRPLTETQRIRNEVELARQAIEDGSVRDLLRFVSESYTDNQGNTRESLRQITLAAFSQHPNLIARAGHYWSVGRPAYAPRWRISSARSSA